MRFRGLRGRGRVTGGSRGSAFSPADLANLSHWYRADVADVAYVDAVNGAVTTWLDQSGNTDDMSQGTAANKPTHSSANNWISFDGSTDRLEEDTPAETTFPKTIVAAVTNDGTSPGGTLYCITNTSSANRYHSLRCTSGTWRARSRLGATIRDSSGIVAVAGATEIVVGLLDPAERSVYVDGVQDTPESTTNTPTGLSATVIGCERERSNYLDFFNGEVHEVCIYTRTLSATEIADITAHLQGKYA